MSHDTQPVGRRTPSALERARADLAAGRPDSARERVTGYLYTLHCRGEYNAEAYLLLGEIYFAMHDYAKAGAVWLLTDRSGADVERAVAAFYERYGRNSTNILRVIKPRAPSELYPPAVQERLKGWDYRYRHYRSRNKPRAGENIPDHDGEEQPGLRGIEIGCLLAIVAFALMGAVWVYLNFFRHR